MTEWIKLNEAIEARIDKDGDLVLLCKTWDDEYYFYVMKDEIPKLLEVINADSTYGV